MAEHTSPWRVSEIQHYEALRDEARRAVAESLVALRSGALTESESEKSIRRTRDELFDRCWLSSPETATGADK